MEECEFDVAVQRTVTAIVRNAMYFTVGDLANAFFSVPVEEKKAVLVRV